ncbi:MAG: diguanylate cyclase [Candidatus Omnitrophica bacterium]|nr:diguanylate cyclase [Candidatus Omnitrophota bacterium]MDD5488424.1 diguanylate cyclase [Candidatus Omnitrophota bacterium]
MKKTRRILVIGGADNINAVLRACLDNTPGYDVEYDITGVPELSRITRCSPDMILIDMSAPGAAYADICAELKRDFATVHIPVMALMNKAVLTAGGFETVQGLDDYILSPPDPVELKVRMDIAIKRSQQSFYASPLTGLPGGIVIEEMLNERIKNGTPFVAGHVDIDNFKSFNDKYGYLKGDRVIMQTAYMLSVSVRNHGNKSDFVGHIGGDDFVMITTPEKYNAICQNFICMFDTIVPFHYAPADRRKGYIQAKDRARKIRRIPIMSVTVAFVIKNGPLELNSIIEMNERIAEVKQYLKAIKGSKYMADRRIMEKGDHLTVRLFSNDESIVKSYKPLGQILIEKNIVTVEQLDSALKTHWKRGIMLGEVMKEMGLIDDAGLAEALMCQGNDLEGSEGTIPPAGDKYEQ